MQYSSHNDGVIGLGKSYPSLYGVPAIDRVDTSIFTIRYHANCLSCDFCNDLCCANGVDIDADNVRRILMCAEQLENYVQIPRTEWFLDRYVNDPDFPGGQYTRTETKEGFCIFKGKNTRGCMIHAFCISNNIDYHTLKPMISSLFPISFNAGLLYPSSEILNNSLICMNKIPTLYRGVRDELMYYFGRELVNELDLLENEIHTVRQGCSAAG